MSHLLSTVNPEAAAALTETPAPSTDAQMPDVGHLPSVGDGVTYYPRPGELRAGKGLHAAIVTAVNAEDATLDLVVVYDADDFIGMRRVPMRENGEGMGWERKVSSEAARVRELEAAVLKLGRQLFGALVLAEGDSLLGIMDEHEDRLEVLENAQQTLAAAPGPAKAKAARKKAKRKANGKASARPTTEPAEAT